MLGRRGLGEEVNGGDRHYNARYLTLSSRISGHQGNDTREALALALLVRKRNRFPTWLRWIRLDYFISI